jgi:hypothetical protein
MLDKELRRIFAEASALAEEKRKFAGSDEVFVQWLVQQVNERGLKDLAELLACGFRMAKCYHGGGALCWVLRRPRAGPRCCVAGLHFARITSALGGGDFVFCWGQMRARPFKSAALWGYLWPRPRI